MYRMQYRSHNRYRILVSVRVLVVQNRYRIFLDVRIRTEFPSSYQKQPREELGNFSSNKVTTAVTGVDIYDVVTRTCSPNRRPRCSSIAPAQFFCRDSLKLFSRYHQQEKQQRRLMSTAPDNALLVLLHRCWDHYLSSFGSGFLAACFLSAVGRNSPVLCAGGGALFRVHDPIFASFDTAPFML
jgi:hypothetical protein